MITIIDRTNIYLYQRQMEQVWRLRHEIFVEEYGWGDIARDDQREIDQFDDEHAVHFLCHIDGELVGYSRMLPTTGPHLLRDVYPHLCEEERPEGSDVWEWTRYCVRKDHRGRGRKLGPVANALLTAIVAWGIEGGLRSMVIQMNPLWMLVLVQLLFRPRPLGIIHEMDGADVLCVDCSFDARTLERLREMQPDVTPVTAHVRSDALAE